MSPNYSDQRRGWYTPNLNPHQFRMRQQVQQFGNHVQYLRDTGNTDELARIAGVFHDVDTTTFIHEAAKTHHYSDRALDLIHRNSGDQPHVDLTEDGSPEYHHGMAGLRNFRKSLDLGQERGARKKREERLRAAEGQRAVLRGFDEPPKGPRRNPFTGEVANKSYGFYVPQKYWGNAD